MGQRPYQSGRNETIEYIQAMLGQLHALARTQGGEMLAYLIEMALIEATDVARGCGATDTGGAGSQGSHQKGNGAA